MNVKRFAVLCILAAAALVLASCATSRLQAYHLYGSALSAQLLVPPEPTMDVHYNVTLDANNPVGSVLSVGSNLAKASQATKAEQAMREALTSVDVPGIVLEEAYSTCVSALQAQRHDAVDGSDFRLVVDIRQYGIQARSMSGAVTLHMALTASIVHVMSGDLVWRRGITINDAANPQMFGLGDIVGNMVTASALSEMTPEQLAVGFKNLAMEAGRSVARSLDRDLNRY
ncbi:MAG TPA: hypothetical protein VFH83_04205 [Spirochaetia bacterium]|nr:hypothetical protein [Spirochaetia bacterium]